MPGSFISRMFYHLRAVSCFALYIRVFVANQGPGCICVRRASQEIYQIRLVQEDAVMWALYFFFGCLGSCGVAAYCCQSANQDEGGGMEIENSMHVHGII